MLQYSLNRKKQISFLLFSVENGYFYIFFTSMTLVITFARTKGHFASFGSDGFSADGQKRRCGKIRERLSENATAEDLSSRTLPRCEKTPGQKNRSAKKKGISGNDPAPCIPPVTRRHRKTVSPRKRSSGPLDGGFQCMASCESFILSRDSPDSVIPGPGPLMPEKRIAPPLKITIP